MFIAQFESVAYDNMPRALFLLSNTSYGTGKLSFALHN